MKIQSSILRVLSSIGIAAAVVGGATAGGCGSSTKVEARTTTTGQELQDLEDARSKGLLTEDEYNKKRQEIMKRK